MGDSDLARLIDDGDFLVYLASNDKNAVRHNLDGSIRSAFETPLGGRLDLDDNWEVALKSLYVRNIQDVVGDVAIFKMNSSGTQSEIARKTLDKFDYYDFGDVIKEVYEWGRTIEIGVDLDAIRASPTSSIYCGGWVTGWHDWLEKVFLGSIAVDPSKKVWDYWQEIVTLENGKSFAKSSAVQAAFSSDSFDLEFVPSGGLQTWDRLGATFNSALKRHTLWIRVNYWNPWIAFPEDVAKMLKMDDDHFDQYYQLGGEVGGVMGGRTIHRIRKVYNNRIYYCFYTDTYNNNPADTFTYIYFHMKDANVTLEVRDPVVELQVGQNVRFKMVSDHFVQVYSKTGDPVLFLNDFSVADRDAFAALCAGRDSLVGAKSALWSLSIPSLNFKELYYSHNSELAGSVVNPCIFVDKKDNGTVFIEWPEEGNYRSLRRLKRDTLKIEIKDRNTGHFVRFWTGFTLVCLHFRHRLLNPKA